MGFEDLSNEVRYGYLSLLLALQLLIKVLLFVFFQILCAFPLLGTGIFPLVGGDEQFDHLLGKDLQLLLCEELVSFKAFEYLLHRIHLYG